MGTRGFIVLVAWGRYYSIYRSHNSFPEGVGAGLLRAILELILRCSGDVAGMCRKMLERMHEIEIIDEEQDHPDHPGTYEISTEPYGEFIKHIFDGELPDNRLFVQFIKSRPMNCATYDYIWTLDFDAGTFSFRHDLGSGAAVWKMKHLYRFPNVQCWVDVAEAWDRDESRNAEARQALLLPFSRNASAAVIQHWWRGVRARMQMFEPGSGVLFELAHRRFENAAACL